MLSIVKVPQQDVMLTYPPSLEGVDTHDGDWISCGMVRANKSGKERLTHQYKSDVRWGRMAVN